MNINFFCFFFLLSFNFENSRYILNINALEVLKSGSEVNEAINSPVLLIEVIKQKPNQISSYLGNWIIKDIDTAKSDIHQWKNNINGKGKLLSMNLMNESTQIYIKTFQINSFATGSILIADE